MVLMQSDMLTLKSMVKDMEQSLSTCSDDIKVLQEKVEEKCEDLEARSRRNNIRIIGVPEDQLPTTVVVSKLLKEALNIDKDIIIDRSHRTWQSKPRPGKCPRAFLARLHYHSDCVEVLRHVREMKQFQVGDTRIYIFPISLQKLHKLDQPLMMSASNFALFLE